jgi:preprotein translocase subunit Sec63
MENWEKYGNPDGFQGNTGTIGLPSFFKNKEYHKLVMLVYLGLMVAFAIVVGVWWSRVSKFSETGVMNDTRGFFYHLLNDPNHAATPKIMLEILSVASEFKPLAVTATSADFAALVDLNKKLTRELDLDKSFQDKMLLKRYVTPWSLKANMLLNAWLRRMELDPIFSKDVEVIHSAPV